MEKESIKLAMHEIHTWKLECPPWIATFTGQRFYPLCPTTKEVHIADIAHALSMKCRFTGHTQEFYSVAEHSVHVADLLRGKPIRVQLSGLLHDAAEAYLPDIAGPIKGFFPEVNNAEDRLLDVVMDTFKLSRVLPDEVKIADAQMVVVERKQVMNGDSKWTLPKIPIPAGVVCHCWTPKQAERMFHKKFGELNGQTKD